MKAADFYRVVNEFAELFKQRDLTKSGRGYVTSDKRFKITLMLDKNGWDAELGWGFMLNAEDETARDEFGNVVDFDAHLQLGGRKALEVVDGALLRDLYATYPKVQSLLKANWVSFADPSHLRRVLPEVLPVLLDEFETWAAGRRTQNNNKAGV